jgi:hypothetical protein
LGPIRHTLVPPAAGRLGSRASDAPAPEPLLHVHPANYRYTGDADPSAPGGISAIYRDLIADDARTNQITDDVVAALASRRHCLVLTQWTEHLDRLVGGFIQVHYLPARRDPVDLASYAADSLLGRLLRAADWTSERDSITGLGKQISDTLAANAAITGV